MAGLFPDNESFDFEMLRAISAARYQGSDVVELLQLIPNIKSGDLESWHDAFYGLAQRVEAEVNDRIGDTPDTQLTPSRRVSVKDRLFAAATYYRNADFYIHGNPNDPRIKSLWEKQTACFDRALAMLGNGTRHTLKSAKGDFEIPIITYKAPGSGPKPTVIMGSGFDGSQEELMHATGFAALERGFNVITYEGPGQCSVVRDQGVGFIHDWERAVTPVVDFAIANAEALGVDPARVILFGYSLGGYLAVRAAAFEHRLAACIAIDGIWDLSPLLAALVSPEALALWRSGTPEGRARFDEVVGGSLAVGNLPTKVQWNQEHGLWAFCTRSASELFDRGFKFTVKDVISGVRCPVFVGDAEADLFFTEQPQVVKEALGRKGFLYTFTRESGAGMHCSIGGASYLNAVMYEWMEKQLQK